MERSGRFETVIGAELRGNLDNPSERPLQLLQEHGYEPPRFLDTRVDCERQTPDLRRLRCGFRLLDYGTRAAGDNLLRESPGSRGTPGRSTFGSIDTRGVARGLEHLAMDTAGRREYFCRMRQSDRRWPRYFPAPDGGWLRGLFRRPARPARNVVRRPHRAAVCPSAT